MPFNHAMPINLISGASVSVVSFMLISLACSSPGSEPSEDVDCDSASPTTCVSQATVLLEGGESTKAVSLLAAACERFHAPSCRTLGVWKRNGVSGTESIPESVEMLLVRADSGGDAEGSYELGVTYRDGLGMAPNPSLAESQFERGCSRDHVRSCYDLGMLLTQGAVPVDTQKAGRAFMTACGFENASSCWNASALAEQGLYTPYGDHTAESLKARACDLGERAACGS